MQLPLECSKTLLAGGDAGQMLSVLSTAERSPHLKLIFSRKFLVSSYIGHIVRM